VAEKKTFPQQIWAMREYFPQFQCRWRWRNPVATWIGTLRPTVSSPDYKVKIEYTLPYPPSVWILSPDLVPCTPHLYPDKNLCLYYPKDRSWRPSDLIAETIVPWTAEWIALYEIWLITNEWYGLEAPHPADEEKVWELYHE
jgi:hypothetical protein